MDSPQNRKFLTSTGVLLKTLADEPVKTNASAQNQPTPKSKFQIHHSGINKQFLV